MCIRDRQYTVVLYPSIKYKKARDATGHDRQPRDGKMGTSSSAALRLAVGLVGFKHQPSRGTRNDAVASGLCRPLALESYARTRITGDPRDHEPAAPDTNMGVGRMN
eukprot:TRINITY_DN38409_c0_g2_i2.p1 TRINITY_DN38409_c0_g2~~TRINITY_DN38409_c0_g2_i2.p1  ORF type:complete len:107 (+),score=7.51 TRINITY_DN38409_c0_g2_i2:177-497(+)